jgi:hypothetical protein
MERRLDELRRSSIIDLIEKMPRRQVPQELSHGSRRGADELDLVRSGLDDSMCTA